MTTRFDRFKQRCLNRYLNNGFSEIDGEGGLHLFDCNATKLWDIVDDLNGKFYFNEGYERFTETMKFIKHSKQLFYGFIRECMDTDKIKYLSYLHKYQVEFYGRGRINYIWNYVKDAFMVEDCRVEFIRRLYAHQFETGQMRPDSDLFIKVFKHRLDLRMSMLMKIIARDGQDPCTGSYMATYSKYILSEPVITDEKLLGLTHESFYKLFVVHCETPEDYNAHIERIGDRTNGKPEFIRRFVEAVKHRDLIDKFAFGAARHPTFDYNEVKNLVDLFVPGDHVVYIIEDGTGYFMSRGIELSIVIANNDIPLKPEHNLKQLIISNDSIDELRDILMSVMRRLEKLESTTS
jgi:hypothetical protein